MLACQCLVNSYPLQHDRQTDHIMAILVLLAQTAFTQEWQHIGIDTCMQYPELWGISLRPQSLCTWHSELAKWQLAKRRKEVVEVMSLLSDKLATWYLVAGQETVVKLIRHRSAPSPPHLAGRWPQETTLSMLPWATMTAACTSLYWWVVALFRKWVLRRIMKWCEGEEVKKAKGLLSDQLATWLLPIQDGYYVAAFPGHALPDFVQIYSMHGWNGLGTRLCMQCLQFKTRLLRLRWVLGNFVFISNQITIL